MVDDLAGCGRGGHSRLGEDLATLLGSGRGCKGGGFNEAAEGEGTGSRKGARWAQRGHSIQ